MTKFAFSSRKKLGEDKLIASPAVVDTPDTLEHFIVLLHLASKEVATAIGHQDGSNLPFLIFMCEEWPKEICVPLTAFDALFDAMDCEHLGDFRLGLLDQINTHRREKGEPPRVAPTHPAHKTPQ